MSEHTPGPWRTEAQDKHMCVYAGEPQGPHRNYVHHGCDDHLHRPDQEIVANARLIAAAPDMLDVLKAIQRAHGLQIHCTLAERARQAIAKAEGK